MDDNQAATSMHSETEMVRHETHAPQAHRQGEGERVKAWQHAGGGALFGLNKGRHADIQIPHTHTSQQEDKRDKQNRKIKNKIMD